MVTAFGLTLAITGVVISWVIVGIGVVIIGWSRSCRWIRETRQDIAELPLEH